MGKWAWGIGVAVLLLIAASLCLPSVGYGLSSSSRARAQAMMSQLRAAVEGFHSEYGVWPPADAEGRIENRLLYHVLAGDEGAVNTRRIVFMEFAARDVDDPARPGTFVDPWWKQTGGNPPQAYVVRIVGGKVVVSDPGPPNGKAPNADPAKFLRSP